MTRKRTRGSGFFRTSGWSVATLVRHVNHLVDVTAVRDTHSNTNSVLCRRSAGFIDYLAIADNAVGDGYLHIIARQDARAAKADIGDDDRAPRNPE